ncbi:MAG TPA: pyridoxamine 5'-phosphate oxidase family protein [Candidatus Saccharibacteria bacterium]|nr:pyridoxamine 5'-phosphate oxidase family protein [Candidatus Saccharibacteria bacterium]
MTEEVQGVFDENVIGTIATINEDGSPWSSPLHMVTDGEYVYWFSKETTAHSQNIARDSRVSVSLVSSDMSKGPKGVYVNGRAEVLSGDDDIRARNVATKRLGSLPPVFDVATAYRLPLGQYDDEKSTGNCWYFYS